MFFVSQGWGYQCDAPGCTEQIEWPGEPMVGLAHVPMLAKAGWHLEVRVDDDKEFQEAPKTFCPAHSFAADTSAHLEVSVPLDLPTPGSRWLGHTLKGFVHPDRRVALSRLEDDAFYEVISVDGDVLTARKVDDHA